MSPFAVQALYFTGNNNADLAAAWLFENQDKNLDADFNEVCLQIDMYT